MVEELQRNNAVEDQAEWSLVIELHVPVEGFVSALAGKMNGFFFAVTGTRSARRVDPGWRLGVTLNSSGCGENRTGDIKDSSPEEVA